MNSFFKGYNSKFVSNLFKSLGIACCLVAVQSCGEPLNDDKKKGVEAATNKRQAESNVDIEFDVAGEEDIESVNDGDAGVGTESDKDSQKGKPSQDTEGVSKGLDNKDRTNSINSGSDFKKVDEEDVKDGVGQVDRDNSDDINGLSSENFKNQNMKKAEDNDFEDDKDYVKNEIGGGQNKGNFDSDENEPMDDSEDVSDDRNGQQTPNDIVNNPDEVVEKQDNVVVNPEKQDDGWWGEEGDEQ